MNGYMRAATAAMVLLALVLASGCVSGLPDWRRGVDPRSGPEFTPEGVRFTLYAPKIERVVVAGDFNNWSTAADPLYDRENDGVWTITIPLDPGSYEYKFHVDGEKWIPDPGNPERVDDGFGGFNSVVVVE